MKTERNIFIAFILNLAFSIFEFFGGLNTGSVAIISDAVHDFGDAASIGLSFFFEKKSRKKPDNNYTYGYVRYSVMGSIITTLVLLIGSVAVICGAVKRLVHPAQINSGGMIVFAVVGVCVNFCAVFFTRKGDSLNQRAVNLHMLEDVLGWSVVLAGAIVMKFTGFVFIDPVMSIGVAVFILINAIKNLKEIIDIFLEKTPHNIDVREIKKHIESLDDVIEIHHIHIRSIDGQNSYATMHIVTNADNYEIKHKVREELKKHGIGHATLELEREAEECYEKVCDVRVSEKAEHCYHHH